MAGREGTTVRRARARAVLAASAGFAAWLVLVAGCGLYTLAIMRECSTSGTIVAVVAMAVAALAATTFLTVTGRVTVGRVTAILIASWVGFYGAWHACNLPDAPTEEYLRKLGDPNVPPRPPADPPAPSRAPSREEHR